MILFYLNVLLIKFEIFENRTETCIFSILYIIIN